MERVPSSESDISSTCQKIPRLLWNPPTYITVFTTVRNWSHFGPGNPLHIPTSSLFESQVIFNTISLYTYTPSTVIHFLQVLRKILLRRPEEGWKEISLLAGLRDHSPFNDCQRCKFVWHRRKIRTSHYTHGKDTNTSTTDSASLTSCWFRDINRRKIKRKTVTKVARRADNSTIV